MKRCGMTEDFLDEKAFGCTNDRYQQKAEKSIIKLQNG